MDKKKIVICICASALFLCNIAIAEASLVMSNNQISQQKLIDGNFNQVGNQKKVTIKANDNSADCSAVTNECTVNPPSSNQYGQEGNSWTMPKNNNFNMQINQH